MSHFALLALLLNIASAPAIDRYSEAPGECEVLTESGAAPTSTDRDHALEACTTAQSRFAELFSGPVSGVKVILWEKPGYRMGLLGGEAAIFWPTSETLSPGSGDPAAQEHIEDQWREVLPHEIAHLLLAVTFFPDNAATPPDGYGTPLPDWMDEAVAIWAEPIESRKRRVEQARNLPAEYLDLERILTMTHPAAGRSAAYISRDGTAAAPEYELWAFYPQSIAVLTFIHDLGGRAAVSELMERLVAQPDEPLAIEGLPGLPSDMKGIVSAWQSWIGEAP